MQRVTQTKCRHHHAQFVGHRTTSAFRPAPQQVYSTAICFLKFNIVSRSTNPILSQNAHSSGSIAWHLGHGKKPSSGLVGGPSGGGSVVQLSEGGSVSCANGSSSIVRSLLVMRR